MKTIRFFHYVGAGSWKLSASDRDGLKPGKLIKIFYGPNGRKKLDKYIVPLKAKYSFRHFSPY